MTIHAFPSMRCAITNSLLAAPAFRHHLLVLPRSFHLVIVTTTVPNQTKDAETLSTCYRHAPPFLRPSKRQKERQRETKGKHCETRGACELREKRRGHRTAKRAKGQVAEGKMETYSPALFPK